MVGKIFDKIHHIVDRNIDPTFDHIEDVCEKYTFLVKPITIGLIGFFPVWLCTAIIVNNLREK